MPPLNLGSVVNSVRGTVSRVMNAPARRAAEREAAAAAAQKTQWGRPEGHTSPVTPNAPTPVTLDPSVGRQRIDGAAETDASRQATRLENDRINQERMNQVQQEDAVRSARNEEIRNQTQQYSGANQPVPTPAPAPKPAPTPVLTKQQKRAAEAEQKRRQSQQKEQKKQYEEEALQRRTESMNTSVGAAATPEQQAEWSRNGTRAQERKKAEAVEQQKAKVEAAKNQQEEQYNNSTNQKVTFGQSSTGDSRKKESKKSQSNKQTRKSNSQKSNKSAQEQPGLFNLFTNTVKGTRAWNNAYNGTRMQMPKAGQDIMQQNEALRSQLGQLRRERDALKTEGKSTSDLDAKISALQNQRRTNAQGMKNMRREKVELGFGERLGEGATAVGQYYFGGTFGQGAVRVGATYAGIQGLNYMTSDNSY